MTVTRGVNAWNALALLTGLLATAILMTGCGKKDEPAAADVDLTKAEDIFSASMALPQPDRNPTSVVVTVNGMAITEEAVETEVENFTARLRMRLPPERIAQMREQIRRQAVDGLVMRQVLRKAIVDENVAVTDEDVLKAKEQISKNLPPDVTLEQQMERLKLDDAALREALRIENLLQAKAGEPIEATEDEIMAFYEENKERFNVPESVTASHILIAFAQDDDEQAKQAKKVKADDIRKKLLEGADFETTAKEQSDCPSKADGGNLGTFARGRMVPAFEEAAFSQQVGEIGSVVETQFGYHIIRILKHDAAHATALEEAQPGIAKMLATRAQQKRIEEYLTGLREQSSIE